MAVRSAAVARVHDHFQRTAFLATHLLTGFDRVLERTLSGTLAEARIAASEDYSDFGAPSRLEFSGLFWSTVSAWGNLCELERASHNSGQSLQGGPLVGLPAKVNQSGLSCSWLAMSSEPSVNFIASSTNSGLCPAEFCACPATAVALTPVRDDVALVLMYRSHPLRPNSFRSWQYSAFIQRKCAGLFQERWLPNIA